MADFVLCNPPFNQRVQGLERLSWPFGSPPGLLREQLALTRRIRHGALDGGIIPTP
ncbi:MULTISPECIES: hypothetical protein [unclassified Streptomyces]|uniref:hypothetical protein n=1 Tax=unclassified Streptomyces TaxID=2593676 RepID=UPI0033EF43D2